MGGEEALRSLRAIRPDVAVILTSGYDQARALQGFSGSEVSGFLKKPYNSRGSGEAGASVLGQRAAIAIKRLLKTRLLVVSCWLLQNRLKTGCWLLVVGCWQNRRPTANSPTTNN